MKWVRISFEDAIAHAVPRELVPPLVAEMIGRGHPIKDFERAYGAERARALGGNPEAISEWAFDLGGMCFADMPDEVIDVDGLAIGVPCDQFATILRAVEDAKIRRFADGPWYYKLKFWMHATVLTVAQRDLIETTMQGRAAEAAQRALDFVREAEAKRAAAGVPVAKARS